MTGGIGDSPDVPAARTEPSAPREIRRLTRSRSDRWLAGVAGGLAGYLGVDPLLLRVAFVVLALVSGGIAIIFYVLAAFIIPDDPTTDVATRRGGSAAAGVAFGLALVILGAIWLLAALDLPGVRWDVVLSAALVGVGGVLVVTAGRGSGGLIVLGLALTTVLSGLSTIDLQVDSAFGERVERPSSMAALETEYSHAFGSFALDLRSLELPEGTTRIRLSNAFGSTVVRLPENAAVRVEANSVFGGVEALGRSVSGVASSGTEETADFGAAARRLELDVNTAFGSTEVQR